MPDAPLDDTLLDVTCPRCGENVSQRLYGPCDPCRTQLRATITGEAHTVESEAFIPRMNVTPNAVALKE